MTVPNSEATAGRTPGIPLRDADADSWVAKGQQHARRPLELAGSVASLSPVTSATATDPDQWPYGNFMVGWLDRSVDARVIRHVPDAAFFRELLRRAYAPVLERRPELGALLEDQSRWEMSVTNDVLQIQLDGLDEGYSMVRHHALMLFFAALWLDEPRRSQWLDLYDEVVTSLDDRPAGRPDLAALAAVEERAFNDFVALAPRTLEPEAAEQLLAEPSTLDHILEYQLCAAAAIGLLWREYRGLPEPEQEPWQREQLSELYRRPDYLEQIWMARP